MNVGLILTADHLNARGRGLWVHLAKVEREVVLGVVDYQEVRVDTILDLDRDVDLQGLSSRFHLWPNHT
jgi:hypothetical protein